MLFRRYGRSGWLPQWRCAPSKAGGLRILDLADGTVRTLTTGYDNFPAWSPQGDLIVPVEGGDPGLGAGSVGQAIHERPQG